jgi:hypothetical protein
MWSKACESPWRCDLAQIVDLEEAVGGRRCLFKSCPRYFKGPGNGAFVMSRFAHAILTISTERR